MGQDADLTRRHLLGLVAGAAAAVPLVSAPAVAQALTAAHKFLTPEEFVLLDELTEMILPADDHSPGARAAKVADYIDGRLAEAFDPEVRTGWRAGLQAVNQAAREAHGRTFMACAEPERLALLTTIAASEAKPVSVAEKFFVDLKGWTVSTYYSSSIGIHQEMEYKGNSLQQEYAGVDVSKAD